MDHYLSTAIESSSRLLSLVDRTPLSPTFGCFDRSFWHFKMKDFPNAGSQQGILSLAKFYSLGEEGSSTHFNSRYILEIIEGGISYTSSIQKSDGSFDEWYFNERGWAGPTGYLIHALAETYLLLKDQLSNPSIQLLLDVIRKGADHLCRSNEGHPLANHIAMAMLPLYESYLIIKDVRYLEHYQLQKERLLKLFNSNEGWSLEYDGADPGYQTATLSFLARVHMLSKEKWIEDFARRSLRFISYFSYPDGSFGGSVGSRHTTNIFYHGIEYWGNTVPLASSLSCWIKTSFKSGMQTLPEGHDDNYLIYRIPELLDAHQFFVDERSEVAVPLLPFEQSNVDIFLQSSGIRILSNESYYCAVALNRGGSYKIFSKKTGSLLDNDCGILLRYRGKLFSSLWCTNKASQSNGVSGVLVEVSPKLFSVLTFMIFRVIFLLLGNSTKVALWLKDFIRSRLMVFTGKSDMKYERDFVFGDSYIKVRTMVATNRPKIIDLIIGGEFWTRYVPQSRYYLANDSSEKISRKNFRLSNSTFMKIIKINPESIKLTEE